MTKTGGFLFFVLAGLAGTMLAGCAQNPGHFSPTAASDPNNAVLYIYRPEATTPGLMKPLKFDYPDVLIDGQSIGVLKYNEYLVTELAPGAHSINITGLTAEASGWASRDIERTVKVDKGKPIFLKLRVEYDVNSMNVGQPTPKYHINLIPVSADNAKYEIRNTDPAKR